MKRAFLALLLLVGAAATVADVARAQDEGIMTPTYQLLRKSLASKSQDLRTSLVSDTQWVGHSHTNHYNATTNPWNIYVGTYKGNLPTATTAIWDFDDQTGLASGDSLQGWWPIRLPYRYVRVATSTDDQRSWIGVDHGNQVNAYPVSLGNYLDGPSATIPGRTFGVTGVWHADGGYNGAATGTDKEVRWRALSGSKSMWCGLRALNDNSVIDPWTNQPYNEQVVQYNVFAGNTAAAPIFRNFPGYGNGWDQMLYRDFQGVNGASMNIQFLYRTAMSTAFSTGQTTRMGWFHGDPLSLSYTSTQGGATVGNFISSSAAGANAPRDSFSVYIGVPVDDAGAALTDGTSLPVWDAQRRWFSEVLRLDRPWFEILGQAGTNPPLADSTNAGATVAVNQTIPWADPANGNAYISAIYNAAGNTGNKVRLVFRLKTNRNYSDEDYRSGSGVLGLGYTALGHGGVQIDNVVVDATTYDFEGANGGVDNGSALPSAAWKSTGKPAATYFHPVDIYSVTWNDLCGLPHSQKSECDLDGIAVSVGNADQSGAVGDGRWPAFQEWIGGFVSPTMSFVTTGTVTPNEMGVTGNMKQGTDDYYLWYDINYGAFVLGNTGTLWNFAVMCYPALTSNGHNAWSDVTGSPFRYYNNFPACQPSIEGLKANQQIHTSNSNGIPDSMRVYMGITSECNYFTGGGGCNSTDGGYFDNIGLILANKASADPTGSVGNDIWQLFNDAFPVNGYSTDNVPAGSPAFDTTTALVKGGINTAQSTGDDQRFSIPADSVTIAAPNGSGVNPFMRVDLVFRILPGPGNYEAVLGRIFPPSTTMNLLDVPTNQAAFVTSGDNSFWGQYIANNGLFGTGGGSGHPSGLWDYMRWNSARCDTIETNIFPVVGKAGNNLDNGGNTYQSTLHEADPHYEALGINKGICFLIDPTGPANSTNISCDTTFTKVGGNLVGDWELAGTTGFDGRFSTKEFTKVIPDGLLTPGSHVQYFFRKQRSDLTGSFAMSPDTTNISPQLSESNFDGHRWQQFGVLPDRWKATEFGGDGMACMLYIDNNDRRGDERIWVSVMDSIGGTKPNRQGAHNGWHAQGAGFGLYNQTNAGVSAAFVNKNSQGGTVWDMYGVKASESSSSGDNHIGNRYAPAPTGFASGKGNSIGPKKDWLRTYYHMVAWLTGDLSFQNVGPYSDCGSDDIGLIEDFLGTAGGTAQPRGLLAQGDGLAEQLYFESVAQAAFLNNYLFADLRETSYTNLTPALEDCPDLTSDPAVVPAGTIYGIGNSCLTLNDVLEPALVDASSASEYEAIGVNAPYVASVEHTPTGTANWHSLVSGWDIFNTFSRYCATSNGRLSYYYNVMGNVFGTICSGWVGTNPTLDVPNNQHGGQFVNFMKVGNSVMRSSNATINFGVENGGRVRVRLYDVTGRVIRTLTDRTYDAGNHAANWDGRDDAGNQVARGVYFARIEFAKGAAINGRVVVLR